MIYFKDIIQLFTIAKNDADDGIWHFFFTLHLQKMERNEHICLVEIISRGAEENNKKYEWLRNNNKRDRKVRPSSLAVKKLRSLEGIVMHSDNKIKQHKISTLKSYIFLWFML
jgi:hypothetical protein